MISQSTNAGVAGYRDRRGSGIEVADIFFRTPLSRYPPYPVPTALGSSRDESSLGKKPNP